MDKYCKIFNTHITVFVFQYSSSTQLIITGYKCGNLVGLISNLSANPIHLQLEGIAWNDEGQNWLSKSTIVSFQMARKVLISGHFLFRIYLFPF